ncbi:MAG: butyrate kinase [Bacteroidota bacterium]
MIPSHRILVVNPGSTSTKMALYEEEGEVCAEVIRHDPASLTKFSCIWAQFDFRLLAVREWAHAHASAVSAVAGVGGLLRPLPGGTYRVNERMLDDARSNIQGEHASNLGCAMAHALAQEYGCTAYVVDPVSVDELEPLARYSGHPLVTRSALSHALNIHAAGRRAAQETGISLESSRFIVAHLGGGISVAPLKGGRIVDINDASSDGPFSPERTGGLPLQQFVTLCFSGSYTERQMRDLVRGRGGLVAYLGTNCAVEVEQMIAEGNAKAREVYEAMGYQIAKEIGAMAAVLKGKVDAVVLTGGLATSAMLVGWITERIRFIAPVLVHPGEDEMRSMAEGTLRVLKGEVEAREY